MAVNSSRFRPELAEKLRTLRRASRVSQLELAQLSGVSAFPIKKIESEGHVPKASTLRQLANGLATYGDGRLDEGLAADYFGQLMTAAGYGQDAPTEVPMRPRPVEDLTDEEVEEALTRISDDPAYSAASLSMAEDWQELSPSARRFVLNSYELARKMDEDIKAGRRRDQSRSQRRPGS